MGGYCIVSMGGPSEGKTPNPGSHFPGNLISREQHMKVYPGDITVYIVLILQLQKAINTSPTLQLLCTSLKEEKCCYNLMIKGDLCLPESWQFQYLAAPPDLVLHKSFHLGCKWSTENIAHVCDCVKTGQFVSGLCECVRCSKAFTTAVSTNSNHCIIISYHFFALKNLGQSLIACFTLKWRETLFDSLTNISNLY